MKRIPEPELMLDPEQASAYAEADFSESDDRFVRRFIDLFGLQLLGEMIDLGCGPGNITFRMASAYPACSIVGVDGSGAMLDLGQARIKSGSAEGARVRFLQANLPSDAVARCKAAAVVSNSLLHHLHDPAVLWQTLKRVAIPGAPVLIADLRRPQTPEAAQEIVDVYAKDAPQVLREDFLNSLMDAFEVGEVADQLDTAGLRELHVDAVGDRHLEVWGRMSSLD